YFHLLLASLSNPKDSSPNRSSGPIPASVSSWPAIDLLQVGMLGYPPGYYAVSDHIPCHTIPFHPPHLHHTGYNSIFPCEAEMLPRPSFRFYSPKMPHPVPNM